MSDKRTFEQLSDSFAYKSDWLTDVFKQPVSPYAFYRDLFPQGSLQLRYKAGGAPEDGGLVGYVTVMHQGAKKTYPKDHILTDDLRTLLTSRHTVAYCSPCSYVGGGRSKGHVRRMHAIVVDLDYVDKGQIENVVAQAQMGFTPIPTYIVNSGTGLHLYYLFDQPVEVRPSNAKGLGALKDAYTGLAWNLHTSRRNEKQYEPIVQNYRVVGSRSKLDTEGCSDRRVVSDNHTVCAWKWGGRYTLEQLLFWKPNPEFGLLGDWDPRIAEARRLLDKGDPGHLTLERARELYPEWYRERIELKVPRADAPRQWKISKGAYLWWLDKVSREAKVGGRYHAIRYLAAYALKAGVDRETLYRDAHALLPILDSKGKDDNERFTAEDVDAALKSYDKPYMVCVSVDRISAATSIPIEKQRHNGQRQADHLEEARSIRDIRQRRKGTSWRDGNSRKGRPNKHHPKADLVRAYATEHPAATQREIADALGISKTTVNKWLRDWQPDQGD